MHQEQSNPNCLRYVVKGSPGVGDPFKRSLTDPNMAGHIGAHALSPPEVSAEAVTLPPLAGKIIGNGSNAGEVVNSSAWSN